MLIENKTQEKRFLNYINQREMIFSQFSTAVNRLNIAVNGFNAMDVEMNDPTQTESDIKAYYDSQMTPEITDAINEVKNLHDQLLVQSAIISTAGDTV